MKITRKKINASSTNDYIYVLMDNGDPIAKGTYDAMMKKQYSYNRPVDVMKFPKAELNSLLKSAKEAHISDPLKFAVNRYINDNNSKKKAESLNSSCTKKSVKSNKINKRRAITSARTLDIYTWEDLTPEQQDYVINNWSDMPKLAEVIYDWHGEDEMFVYDDEKDYIAGKFVDKYGFGINTDKIYWQSNSQGPYPEWNFEQIFDTIWGETTTGIPWTIEFYGRGLDVQCSLESDGYADEEPEESDVDAKLGITLNEIMSGAQQFIDEIWSLINDVCTSYPDDEWVRDTLDANPDSFEFTISDDGTVKYF